MLQNFTNIVYIRDKSIPSKTETMTKTIIKTIERKYTLVKTKITTIFKTKIVKELVSVTYTYTKTYTYRTTLRYTYTKQHTVTVEHLTTMISIQTLTIPHEKVSTIITTSTITKFILGSSDKVPIPVPIELEVVNIARGIIESIYNAKPSLSPPSCPVLRTKLDESTILVAFSKKELDSLKDLAYKLRVVGNPERTALNIARFVYSKIVYTSDSIFNAKNCVLMPTETLKLGKGDCEDRALLIGALLLASNEFNKIYVLKIRFRETPIGHVDTAIEIGGKLYIITSMSNPYLMELTSDYCGYWQSLGLSISNITMYAVIKSKNSVQIARSKPVELACYAEYPPPIDNNSLRFTESLLNSLFKANVYNVPEYLWLQYKYLDRNILFTPYYRFSIPVDWYSKKDKLWIAWRIFDILNTSFISEIKSALEHHGCGLFKAVLSFRKVELYTYGLHGELQKFEELRPVIDVYLLLPYKCNVPPAHVEINNDLLNITINALDNINILIYPLNGTKPILGIVPKGYVYQNIPYVEADKWIEINGITLITVSMKKLPLSTGIYKLIIWIENEIAYVIPIELR